MSNQNKKNQGRNGCLLAIFMVFVTTFALEVGTQKTYLLLNLVMLIVILHLLPLALLGANLLALPFTIIKRLLKGERPIINLNVENEDELMLQRAWLIFPVTLLVFLLGYLISSRLDGDLYAYLGVGFGYASVKFWMMRNNYYNPFDYDYEWLG